MADAGEVTVTAVKKKKAAAKKKKAAAKRKGPVEVAIADEEGGPPPAIVDIRMNPRLMKEQSSANGTPNSVAAQPADADAAEDNEDEKDDKEETTSINSPASTATSVSVVDNNPVTATPAISADLVAPPAAVETPIPVAVTESIEGAKTTIPVAPEVVVPSSEPLPTKPVESATPTIPAQTTVETIPAKPEKVPSRAPTPPPPAAAPEPAIVTPTPAAPVVAAPVAPVTSPPVQRNAEPVTSPPVQRKTEPAVVKPIDPPRAAPAPTPAPAATPVPAVSLEPASEAASEPLTLEDMIAQGGSMEAPRTGRKPVTRTAPLSSEGAAPVKLQLADDDDVAVLGADPQAKSGGVVDVDQVLTSQKKAAAAREKEAREKEVRDKEAAKAAKSKPRNAPKRVKRETQVPMIEAADDFGSAAPVIINAVTRGGATVAVSSVYGPEVATVAEPAAPVVSEATPATDPATNGVAETPASDATPATTTTPVTPAREPKEAKPTSSMSAAAALIAETRKTPAKTPVTASAASPATSAAATASPGGTFRAIASNSSIIDLRNMPLSVLLQDAELRPREWRAPVMPEAGFNTTTVLAGAYGGQSPYEAALSKMNVPARMTAGSLHLVGMQARAVLGVVPCVDVSAGVLGAYDAEGVAPAPRPKSKVNLLILEESGPAKERRNCFSCKKSLEVALGTLSTAKQCNYLNEWFCEGCFGGALVSIPARMLHSKDFRQYKVSNDARLFLLAMQDEPVIELSKYPLAHNKEAKEGIELRRRLFFLRDYINSCRERFDLLLQFETTKRVHLIERPSVYSVEDLRGLSGDPPALLTFMREQIERLSAHVVNCELCKWKGHICLYCQDRTVIYPFDTENTTQCGVCNKVFHRTCYAAARTGCIFCASKDAREMRRRASSAAAKRRGTLESQPQSPSLS